MCGFVGFCGSNITDKSEKMRVSIKMTEKIKHRGPDDIGYYFDEYISLGFARLKILDLSGGAQPMTSEDGRYVLCFNGEIYNFKELREELADNFGQKFKGTGDTEVLLYSLVHYGEGALEKLRGMFAFAFYDRIDGTLLLGRDPFGIKPLYYGIFDNCFMFASEIKALTEHPQFVKRFNLGVLPYYLQFQYVPCEETAFLGVKRLMAGRILVYRNGKIQLKKYFSEPRYLKKAYIPFTYNGKTAEQKPYLKGCKNASEELLRVLEASVSEHMRADVEVGAFLSGGVDSGLICALAEPKKVFSVGFKNDGFDERARAQKTAERLGIPITTVEIDADEFFDTVLPVQYHSDEPYANLSAIPLYLISKRAKEDVSVVLSGEGADELFGGYEWYQDSIFGRVYRALPQGLRRTAAKRALEGRIGDFLRRNSGDAEREFIGQAKIMTPMQANEILAEPYKSIKYAQELTLPIYSEVKYAPALRKKMYLDARLWLPFDILNKADKMTMAHSLELRVPYLDLAVLGASQGYDARLLMRGKTGKYILRRAALNRLDSETAYRAKKGFPVPLRAWIREKRYANILKTAFTGAIGRRFFNTDMLCRMLEEHVRGDKNNARVLYTVYAFITWYGVFFGDEPKKKGEIGDATVFTDNTRS